MHQEKQILSSQSYLEPHGPSEAVAQFSIVDLGNYYSHYWRVYYPTTSLLEEKPWTKMT